MRKVILRMKEQEKYVKIKELVDHGGNKDRVALKLGISKRQVNRLIIIYKEKGKSGFVHGNRSIKPISTLDKSISKDIILLYKNKYQDWNFSHFQEFLEMNENIKVSYKFIYKTLTKEGILSPKARKRTRKEFVKQQLLKEKKINLAMNDEQINTIVNHEMDLEDSPPRGEKPKYFGELIEQDGLIHQWFDNTKTDCLVIKAFDSDLLVTIDENVYELKGLNRNEKLSREFNEVIETHKEKEKYIPPMSHPWKLESFKRQMRHSHQKHVFA